MGGGLESILVQPATGGQIRRGRHCFKSELGDKAPAENKSRETARGQAIRELIPREHNY